MAPAEDNAPVKLPAKEQTPMKKTTASELHTINSVTSPHPVEVTPLVNKISIKQPTNSQSPFKDTPSKKARVKKTPAKKTPAGKTTAVTTATPKSLNPGIPPFQPQVKTPAKLGSPAGPAHHGELAHAQPAVARSTPLPQFPPQYPTAAPQYPSFRQSEQFYQQTGIPPHWPGNVPQLVPQQDWNTPHHSHGVYYPGLPGYPPWLGVGHPGETTYPRPSVPRMSNPPSPAEPYQHHYTYAVPPGTSWPSGLQCEGQATSGTLPIPPPGAMVPPRPVLAPYMDSPFHRGVARPGAVEYLAQQSREMKRKNTSQDLVTPTKTIAKAGAPKKQETRPLVVRGASPVKKNAKLPGAKGVKDIAKSAGQHVAVNVGQGDAQGAVRSAAQSAPLAPADIPEIPRTAPVSQPEQPTPTTPFGFDASGLPTWPSGEVEPVPDGVRAPRNTPEGVSLHLREVIRSRSYLPPKALFVKLVGLIINQNDHERRSALAFEEYEARLAREAQAAAVDKAAELQEAFDEIDDLVASFNWVVTKSDDTPRDAATPVLAESPESAKTTASTNIPVENSTPKDTSGFTTSGPPSGPAAWSGGHPCPEPSSEPDNRPGEESDGNAEELSPTTREKARKIVAFLGLETSPITNDEKDDKKVTVKDSVSDPAPQGVEAWISGSRTLTELQLAAQRAKNTRKHAAVRERATMSAATRSSDGLLSRSATPLSSSVLGQSNNDSARGQTVSPFSLSDHESLEPVVQLNGGIPGSAEVLKKTAKDPRPVHSVCVPLVPFLSSAEKKAAAEMNMGLGKKPVSSLREACLDKPNSTTSSAVAKANQAGAVLPPTRRSGPGVSLPSIRRRNSNLFETLNPDQTASHNSYRIVHPPPGFQGLNPVALKPRSRPQSPVSLLPNSTPILQQRVTPSQKDYLLRLLRSSYLTPAMSEAPNREARSRRIGRNTDELLSLIKSGEVNVASYQQPTPQQSTTSRGPDLRNPSSRVTPEDSIMSQVSKVDGSHSSRERTENSSQTSYHTISGQAQPRSQSVQARDGSNTLVSPLAGLVGNGEGIAAERLSWERMKGYYPNGPPSNMAPYIPIPDSWQSAYPVKSSTTLTQRGMSTEEHARYHAQVDKAFYSGSQFFGMTPEEATGDVNLRHIWACYLESLGISRADFDKEYNRYANVFDNNYRPSQWANMTVEELKAMPAHQVTEPMITMAFRNLLLHRTEAGLPDGQKTWPSNFVRDHPAITPRPVANPQPATFGAVGDPRDRRPDINPLGAIGDGRKGKGPSRGEIDQADDEEVDEDDEDDGEGSSTAGRRKAYGRRRKPGVRRVRPKKHKHLLGYAC